MWVTTSKHIVVLIAIWSRSIYVRENIHEERRYDRPTCVTHTDYDPSPVLDDRIDEFTELIRDEYNIEELGDPLSVTDVRIHCDCCALVYLTRVSTLRTL